jgi:disulfide bond formation protein DsbB
MNFPAVNTVTYFLSFLTLIANLGLVLLAFLFIKRLLFRKSKDLSENLWNKVAKLAKKYGVLFAFLVATASMLGSLFYSEFAGWEPCKLCWFQRIFIYPQVIILAIALIKKFKTEFVYYSIVLSIIGALVAVYQYYLQRFSESSAPCSAVDYSASCAKNFVLSLGYITIPMMSLTAYLLIIVFLSFYTIEKK